MRLAQGVVALAGLWAADYAAREQAVYGLASGVAAVVVDGFAIQAGDLAQPPASCRLLVAKLDGHFVTVPS